MRGAASLFLGLGLIALSTSGADARDVKISGTHSVNDIEVHCNGNGTFFNGPNGGYGCAGNGGGTVTCTNKGKCTGTVSRETESGGKGSGVSNVISGLEAKSKSDVAGHPVNDRAPTTTSNPSSDVARHGKGK